MATRERPSIERLHELFHADFERGILIRKTSNNQYKIGSVAGGYDPRYDVYHTKVDGQKTYVHHILWAMKTGEWHEGHINHRSGKHSDDSFGNLRPATMRQAKQHSRLYRNNKFGLKGVSRCKDKFRADIKVNGKTICLGRNHATPELAHAAYVEAAHKYFGEFARAA